MGVRLRWTPRVEGDSQKVYRATAVFDKNSLPSALATIGATASDYDDSTTTEGVTYWYAVSVVEGARERISEIVSVVAGPGGGGAPEPLTITYVGALTGSKAGQTSGTTSLDLSTLSLLEGDIVIAGFATGAISDKTLSITDGTTDYTLLGSELYSDDSYDTNLRVAYKIMGASPDSSVVFGPTTNAQDAGTYFAFVLRGVDTTTPLSVTVEVATGGNTGRPTPPPITPVDDGAVIICVGAAGYNTPFTFTSADLDNFQTIGQNDDRDSMIGVGMHNWSGGTYTPSQFGGGTTNSAASWAAVTVALKPGTA